MCLLGCVATLGGCLSNSSNPVVGVQSCVLDSSRAAFELRVENPSGRHLTLTRVRCDVSQGESSFPLATIDEQHAVDLPAHTSGRVHLAVRLDPTSPEADSTLFHLNGEALFDDHTGYLGVKSLDLTHTNFQIETSARRGGQ